MPAIVNLEGSEEDFARLLVFHKIITKDQLQKALEARQTQGAKVGQLEPLRDTLLRTKLVSSGLMFDVLRMATKVIEICTKCGAVHHIHYYHPHSRYFCMYCKGPLRVTDPGQSQKWQPGELAASVQELNEPLPPGDDEPSIASLPSADETMLDFGDTPRVSSKPKASPPPPPATPLMKPVPLPADVGAPVDRSIGNITGGGETMLDLGDTPRTSSKPKALPALPPESGPPDRSVGNIAGGGETMLDLGDTPRTSSKPKALPTLPPESGPPDRSVGMAPGGGTTMLDLGSGTRPPGGVVPPLPVDPTATIVPGAGGGDTMLDMGTIAGGRPPIKQIADFTTSVFPGSKRPLPSKLPAPPPENPVLPATGSYDVTTRQGSKTDATLVVPPNASTPASESASTVDRTQMQTTPKTAGGAGMSNQRALPPEVVAASKDANRVFGKYILMNELGRGGAGVVYKAWDTLLLQYLAIKFIRNQDEADSDSTSGSSQIEEFQREARMSVRLRHPNIVRIYEMGCMSNRYYLSMEYIEGGTLLAMIHGGKERNQKTRFNSNPVQFLKIMINISLAVDYAHHEKQSVIHRDLKPHNVLVDKAMNPYVVDFGLAKEVDSGDGATLTGVVKGTPTYMAPEQAEGRNRDVDIRTDIYALGAILYEMLTGRPPFLGESVPEILRKIATELPERPNESILKAIAAEAAATTASASATVSKSKTKALLVPKALETICLKALEKNKADRYQTAKEFAEDIDRYMKGEDILASEPNLWRRFRRSVRRHPILSATAAAILLAAGTGLAASKYSNKGDGGEAIRLQQIALAVKDGDEALSAKNWESLGIAVKALDRLDAKHAKVVEWTRAGKDHEELIAKVLRDWNSELARVPREPLAKLLPGLRESFRKAPELQQKFKSDFRDEIAKLQAQLVQDGRAAIGSGDRKPWVSDVVKNMAKATKTQSETVIGLAADKELPVPTDASIKDNLPKLGIVVAYQGTWNLQVNVAPFAEVRVLQADRVLASEFTPVGLKELEVIGTSFTVELCWPSREDAKVKIQQEIKDLQNGQTVMIRGDVTKEILKQERR